jgi:hypothetical protein
LEAIRKKLGYVRQSNLRTTGIAWFAGQGATVTLVYDTNFAEGTGIEQFVWHIKTTKQLFTAITSTQTNWSQNKNHDSDAIGTCRRAPHT